jgi:hypothetical protein
VKRNPPADADSAQAFWTWFAANETRFRNIQTREKEALLDELKRYLGAFCDSLWFEIGGHPNGPWELIISAQGCSELFPKVRELIGASPALDGWQFIAFKPAHGFDFVTEYDGLTVSPEATWFMPLESSTDSEALGLRVAYAHFDQSKEKTYLAATYVMLEAGLGELDVAEKIQHVEVCAAPSAPESAGYIVLHELPQYLRRRAKQSGRP